MKFTHFLVLGMLLVVSIILTSCNGSEEKTTEMTPSLADTNVGVVTDQPSDVEKEDLPYNIWVQELKLKGQDVTEYRYNYQSDYLNSNGLIIPNPSYYVYIKGDKVKKVYTQPIKFAGNRYYDTVYLDNAAQTAYGACKKTGITCDDLRENYFSLVYAKEKLEITPVEMVNRLDRYAKSTNQISYSNRQVTLVESELTDGKVERLYVDEYFGLPVHQEIYTLVDGKEVVLEEREFDRLDAVKGAVSMADVTIPEELVLLS